MGRLGDSEVARLARLCLPFFSPQPPHKISDNPSHAPSRRLGISIRYLPLGTETDSSWNSNVDLLKVGQESLQGVQYSAVAPVVNYDRQFLRHLTILKSFPKADEPNAFRMLPQRNAENKYILATE